MSALQLPAMQPVLSRGPSIQTVDLPSASLTVTPTAILPTPRLPSGAPVNSANVSSTLSYATSAPSLAVSSSASFRNGNAIPIASEAPMTTTITSYSTSEVGYGAPKSVTIAPGSGGYNVTGATSGVASSTATPIASSSPIQTFTGAASTDGTPHAMVGAVAVAIAIAAAVL